MNSRILIALVILAVLGAISFSRLRSNEAETTISKPSVTLPTIKRDDISKIELKNPEKKLEATLIKQDGKWSLSAPLAAKADGAAVDALLDKLSDLQVASVVAKSKESHAKLGVDAEHAIQVKAFAGDKLLIDALVGASKSSGTMLRKQGEEQVVAVKGSIRYAFEKELKYLRDRTITDVDHESIKAISVSSAKGTFKFEKAESGWMQAKGEKPIKDFAPNKVQSLVSTFAKLRATDFAAPDATPASTGLNAPKGKITLTPKEGAEVVVEIGSDIDNSDTFTRAAHNEVLYRISKYTADRLVADAAAFSEPPKKPGEAAPPAAPPGMQMGGGGEIPPEILRQLQQQMGQQGAPH